MPWVKQEMCTGCGLCLKGCPVGAIVQNTEGLAEIDEVKCMRCGRCHSVCPRGAVRHDSERIPEEVAENLRWVRGMLEQFPDLEERAEFMQRMVRFFKKQREVNERTIAVIIAAEEQPAEDIDAAIMVLSENSAADSSGT